MEQNLHRESRIAICCPTDKTPQKTPWAGQRSVDEYQEANHKWAIMHRAFLAGSHMSHAQQLVACGPFNADPIRPVQTWVALRGRQFV